MKIDLYARAVTAAGYGFYLVEFAHHRQRMWSTRGKAAFLDSQSAWFDRHIAAFHLSALYVVATLLLCVFGWAIFEFVSSMLVAPLLERFLFLFKGSAPKLEHS